jgi:hypothetical protein
VPAPTNRPTRRPAPIDDAIYSVGKSEAPHEPEDLAERYMQAALRKRASAAPEPPPRPRLPMLTGVFTFPFYLKTLEAWIGITFGLMVFAWLLMVWLESTPLGMMSARLFGLPTCAAGLLTLGYAFSCCLTIMEETCEGWDSIEVSPGIDWKEWTWNFAHITALLLQAAMIGQLARFVSGSASWTPMIAGTLAAFPLVLLGALAADGAWVPLAIGAVLRSLRRHCWAWALFYLETTPLVVGWTLLTAAGLKQAPWLAPLYAAPLLAAIILIYARLVGRLAGCIAAGTSQTQSKGDDRDDS